MAEVKEADMKDAERLLRRIDLALRVYIPKQDESWNQSRENIITGILAQALVGEREKAAAIAENFVLKGNAYTVELIKNRIATAIRKGDS